MQAPEIIQDHQRHYIARLVNRSPLLHLLPGSAREDIFTLFQDITPNTPSLFPSQINYTASTTPADLLKCLCSKNPTETSLLNVTKSNTSKLQRIQREADDYKRDTGQHCLFIGYPLVYTTFEAVRESFVLAPLFLWPISLRVEAKRIIFSRIADRDDEDEIANAIFNKVYSEWLKHEKNIELNWDDENEEKFISLYGLSKMVNSIFNEWRECKSDFNPQTPSPLFASPKETAKVFKSWAKADKDPQIINSALIGNTPYKGQALFDDLERIKKKIETNPNDCGVLKYFIFPKSKQQDIKAPVPTEMNKWLVLDSDHSQESVIWQARISPLIILQGPPGTGKSQTIVNLIADAVAQKKKVIVVCQKRAALEVIKKRLDGCNLSESDAQQLGSFSLGDLSELIDDPSNDRAKVVRGLRDIEPSFDSEMLYGVSQRRNETCVKVVNAEAKLDEYVSTIHDRSSNQKFNYSDLIANLVQMASDGVDLFRAQKQLWSSLHTHYGQVGSYEKLETLLRKYSDHVEIYKKTNYNENSWRNLSPSVHKIDQFEIAGILDEIIEIFATFNTLDSPRLHSDKSAWFVEHPMIQTHYLDLLSNPLMKKQKIFFQFSNQCSELTRWLKEDYVHSLIIAARHDTKDDNELENLKNNVGWVEDILLLNKEMNSNLGLRTIAESMSDKPDLWPVAARALVFRVWFEKIRSNIRLETNEVKSSTRELGRHWKKKKELDVAEIRTVFTNKVAHRNQLTDSNLLRLRSAGGVPKTSLRRLYNKGFDLLQQIKPILLTNPETASAILQLKAGLYDVAIIDEASQMFMADSMPILFRTKSVIISGDKMQMPPSDFFVSAFDEELISVNEEEDEEDESHPDQNRMIAAEGEYGLLDAAESAVNHGSNVSPELLVHYRSEHRELIDFSNNVFYKGKLIIPDGNLVLPSYLPTPIVLKDVRGTFNNGINATEAKEVVKVLKELWRLKDPPTIGVIAFNVKQRDAIIELVEEECQRDSDFAQKYEQERVRNNEGEFVGFFVRSVEHIQGDERDIIIFSTTYGSDKNNFGPISKKEKGRRRLNVAVTRAKTGMIILTSLNIDRISNDSKKEESENYYFWKYMCYARAISKNDLTLANEILKSIRGDKHEVMQHVGYPDSPFEEDVADFLRENGYFVKHQIGESGFRIDLGVKREESDLRYLCGIECDGKRYHNSWNARMNDIWRQEILESKGWKILRIWSSDWYFNKVTREEILVRLDKLR